MVEWNTKGGHLFDLVLRPRRSCPYSIVYMRVVLGAMLLDLDASTEISYTQERGDQREVNFPVDASGGKEMKSEPTRAGWAAMHARTESLLVVVISDHRFSLFREKEHCSKAEARATMDSND